MPYIGTKVIQTADIISPFHPKTFRANSGKGKSQNPNLLIHQRRTERHLLHRKRNLKRRTRKAKAYPSESGKSILPTS